MENDFILLLEKEVFIEQLRDIMDKAEDILSEEREGETSFDQQGGGPQQSQGGPGTLATEVSERGSCWQRGHAAILAREERGKHFYLGNIVLPRGTVRDDFAREAANSLPQRPALLLI